MLRNVLGRVGNLDEINAAALTIIEDGDSDNTGKSEASNAKQKEDHDTEDPSVFQL